MPILPSDFITLGRTLGIVLLTMFLASPLAAQQEQIALDPDAAGVITHLQFQPFAPTPQPRVQDWQLLPEGLLYRSYLAGPKESRLGTSWLHDPQRGWVWDSTLGGRVGLARLEAADTVVPSGLQIDLEGAAFPRLDVEEASDLESADFRVGVPLTWRRGPMQAKLALYHLSSHVGDEFLRRNQILTRTNFSRNAVVVGQGLFLTPEWRIYAEADYAFDSDGGCEPWWFQFGTEFAPSAATGPRGAPFLAANALLRQEADFGGTWSFMAGWSWRGNNDGPLLRVGAQAAFGKTSQLEFSDRSESLLGFGLWYDH